MQRTKADLTVGQIAQLNAIKKELKLLRRDFDSNYTGKFPEEFKDKIVKLFNSMDIRAHVLEDMIGIGRRNIFNWTKGYIHYEKESVSEKTTPVKETTGAEFIEKVKETPSKGVHEEFEIKTINKEDILDELDAKISYIDELISKKETLIGIKNSIIIGKKAEELALDLLTK